MKILKNSIFWGLYVYTATILTQYGFISYFGIPSNFIEPSIRDNIIFFFTLIKGMVDVFIATPFLYGTILLLIVVFVVFTILNKIPKILVLIATGFLLIISIFAFYNLGGLLAQTAETFPVLSNCLPGKDNVTYIVPAFFQTTAIIIPVTTDTHKIIGSFFLKEAPGSDCEIQNKMIGKVLK
jgi:hypothetical protein